MGLQSNGYWCSWESVHFYTAAHFLYPSVQTDPESKKDKHICISIKIRMSEDIVSQMWSPNHPHGTLLGLCLFLMLIPGLHQNPKNQNMWKQVPRICNFNKHTVGISQRKGGIPPSGKRQQGKFEKVHQCGHASVTCPEMAEVSGERGSQNGPCSFCVVVLSSVGILNVVENEIKLFYPFGSLWAFHFKCIKKNGVPFW